MGLFLPILRFLMLFLNIYDSYKTLKPPPPSSRNPARPSVRAMTQRKRDIKGCLAVWLVSLALYERVLESLVSLFIPFYDEFKSLVLLFLIVTRARGAEPIYLHLIRPILKPHTRTLDAALELMLMVGDFLIALSTYPVQLAAQWWKGQFARFFEPSSSEDSSDESSIEVCASEVSSISSGQRPIPSARAGDGRNLRKSSNDTSNENRRPYISLGAHRKRGFSQEDLPQETTPESSGKRPSSSRQSSRSQTLPAADNTGEIDSRYQIWYPPTADNGIDATEVDRTIRPLDSVQVREQMTGLTELQTDEWRQYPPFPSAYPPTPIATTSRLVSNSLGLSPSIYPPISEEVNSQEDFHMSLLSRGPLNPTPAIDLSDHRHNRSGIQPFLASDADESVSTDGCGNEDDDEFNITLKTPLRLNGSMRARPRPSLLISPPPPISAVSSTFSVPSRSSALTTADNGSPLRTDTWSDSSLSSAAFSRLPPSVVGKKRSHPRAAKGGARKVEEGPRDHESSDLQPSSSSHERRSITPFSHPQALERLESVSTSDAIDSIDIAHSISDPERNEDSDDQEQIPPKEKRRKVTMRTLNPTRPVRSKTSSVDSPPRMRKHTSTTSRKTRKGGGRHLEIPAPPAARRSGRLKAGGSIELEGRRDQTTAVNVDSLRTESSMRTRVGNK